MNEKENHSKHAGAYTRERGGARKGPEIAGRVGPLRGCQVDRQAWIVVFVVVGMYARLWRRTK